MRIIYLWCGCRALEHNERLVFIQAGVDGCRAHDLAPGATWELKVAADQTVRLVNVGGGNPR